jgi:hypothetical protein
MESDETAINSPVNQFAGFSSAYRACTHPPYGLVLDSLALGNQPDGAYDVAHPWHNATANTTATTTGLSRLRKSAFLESWFIAHSLAQAIMMAVQITPATAAPATVAIASFLTARDPVFWFVSKTAMESVLTVNAPVASVSREAL